MPTLTLRSTAFLTAAILSRGAFAQEPPSVAQPAIPPIVEAWAEAWNAYDAEAMAALFTKDGVYRDEAFQATFTGPDGVRAWVGITAAAIPVSEVEVLDAFGSGDRIAVRWIFHGTPLNFGPLKGVGLSFSVPAVAIIDLEDGRIANLTDTYNLADLFRQAGVDPSDWVPPDP